MAGRLQLGIAVGHLHQRIDLLGNVLLGLQAHVRRRRAHCVGASLGDSKQDVALMACDAADGFDHARDQVVTVFEMHVDVGEGRIATLVQRHEAVVRGQEHEQRRQRRQGHNCDS